ncbi:hypothetical protein ACFWPP_01390 [Streptomyces anulatus]|uniref:hypothetical protein n=1 Tax=Streptomyces anulatus TaxID=1892 RepID=UPI003667BF75
MSRERFLLITDAGQGLVRAVAAITAVTEHDTDRGRKKALEADLLGPGHPMYDRYINQPDPLANDSRNSVKYGDLPEELPSAPETARAAAASPPPTTSSPATNCAPSRPAYASTSAAPRSPSSPGSTPNSRPRHRPRDLTGRRTRGPRR